MKTKPLTFLLALSFLFLFPKNGQTDNTILVEGPKISAFDFSLLPPEKELTDALAKQQSDFDAQEYARERAGSYPSTGDQLDMIYKDNLNSTTTHKDAVEAVKTKWPKNNTGPVE